MLTRAAARQTSDRQPRAADGGAPSVGAKTGSERVSKARALLADELALFEERWQQFLAEAYGKYVLIKGNEIAGFFDGEMDAVHVGWDRYGAVPFLVRRVV